MAITATAAEGWTSSSETGTAHELAPGDAGGHSIPGAHRGSVADLGAGGLDEPQRAVGLPVSQRELLDRKCHAMPFGMTASATTRAECTMEVSGDRAPEPFVVKHPSVAGPVTRDVPVG